MHASLILLTIIAALITQTLQEITSKSETPTYTCSSSSPLSILLAKKSYQHPYSNINIPRASHILDPSKRNITFGVREDYQILAPIAPGGFAKVFKARHKPTNELVALKVFIPSREEVIAKEVEILKELADAPNFLHLRDSVKDGEGMIALVFDYFQATDYKFLFYNTTELQIKRFFYETLRSLDFAHRKGIMHRDIKPQNVMMNTDLLEIKLIDWGHAVYYLPGKEYDVKVASMPYKSPELLLNYTLHDYSLDIWSTGCLYAALLFRKMPFFRGENYVSQLDAIAQFLGTLKLRQYADKHKEWMDLSILDKIGDYPERTFEELINENNTDLVKPEAIDLLKRMIIYDHEMRITAEDALKHSYFNEFH